MGCTVSGSEWMDAAEKARKKAEKEAAKSASLTKEDKFDAFGNKIEEKQAAKKIPKSAQEDQEARRRAAQEGPGGVDRRGAREGGLRSRDVIALSRERPRGLRTERRVRATQRTGP